ncbi:hypothetical protein U8C31_18245 [Sinorhizobium medicae]|uniref:hypothetical protein n=1 Tax=Sinorhizobium medicae TaxID=110321 RepID=UPI002AF6A9A0|nr:hypothetical protein [Sinorhizobium medicae]WQO72178.1 hypothetical protein U8C31_18245 [Sinorhizobium medicae]
MATTRTDTSSFGALLRIRTVELKSEILDRSISIDCTDTAPDEDRTKDAIIFSVAPVVL